MEIAKVLEIGVESERIIFANPTKQVSHVRYAAQNGVRAMTFDSETELYKVKQHHPRARMVLRMRCDAKKVQCPLGIKFGALPKDAPRLIELARQLDIDLVGISFHVGSGCAEPQVLFFYFSNACTFSGLHARADTIASAKMLHKIRRAGAVGNKAKDHLTTV